MAVDTLDISVHSTTALGSGTIACNARHAADARHLTLNFTAAGSNTVDIALGNEPLSVKVFDMSNVIVWEWARGMAATKTIKTVTAGTTTVDTTSAIVVSGDANNGNHKVTLSAALAAAAALLVVKIDL